MRAHEMPPGWRVYLSHDLAVGYGSGRGGVGWVVEHEGALHSSHHHRRDALRTVRREAGMRVRVWTVSAEHAALGCHEERVRAQTERGALRAARVALAARWSLPGWTWRVRDDAGQLVASRRGDSVRGWCRSGVSS